MNNLLLIVFLMAAPAAFATEITSYEVNGMHCEGCQALVTQKFCALPAVENCEVKLIPKKKNTGMISYSVKPGQTLDEATIAASIKQAGDEYTLNTKSKKIKSH